MRHERTGRCPLFFSKQRERERRLVLHTHKGQPPLQNTQGAGRVLQPEQNNVLKTQNSRLEPGEVGAAEAREQTAKLLQARVQA